MEPIVGALPVCAGDKIPTRSIPVFGQGVLGAAFDRHNELTRRPYIGARQGDDPHENRIRIVGIEGRCRDDVPDRAIPMNGERV